MIVSLVEEVVVDFDLSVGFEIIRQQHDRNRHLAQIINLQKTRRQQLKPDNTNPHLLKLPLNSTQKVKIRSIFLL